ncbi:Asp23/Gls24 family envelope stress response protein, partial [Eubacteriales bacterium OttesenSCG-928-A19]|nr:Asp23/Gls24 family envelope stress response protein [Eubacteriales bacterium OttesenSCG-928-A19]
MSDHQNLPVNLDAEREVGTITYANEVIAIIAGMAMNEVEGVIVPQASSGGIADLFGRKPATRGVKVEVGTEESSVDLVLNVEYGQPIQKVCTEVQENVRKAIETMTGLHVIRVDIHVVGISFEKETQEMKQGYVKATERVETLSETDMNNETETADIDDPPEGVDPDTLPIRNVQMNDAWTGDENEEAS